MPFDGTLTPRQVHLLDKLDEVSEYLASENIWCKRRLHDPNGQRCLLGALKEAHADWHLYQPVISAARQVTGITYHRIETFNDAARTDFSTVRACSGPCTIWHHGWDDTARALTAGCLSLWHVEAITASAELASGP